MHDAIFTVPPPYNEPVFDYAPGSSERTALSRELGAIAGEEVEIPCIIGGQRVKTGKTMKVTMPCDHGHVLATFHMAGPEEVAQAVNAADDARRDWEHLPWTARAGVILRAAELLAKKYRMRINAATMLGQGKTCHQAEIDAACELIDFWRYNAAFAEALYTEQPESSPGIWNMMELRPLEGFTLAVTPFNFTAIAGNLPTAPALMGNTVLWKPAETQTLAAYYTYLLLEEAGLPPGVINFLPGDGAAICGAAMKRPELSGLHFTGSTNVFRALWKQAAENLETYRTYPRLVGETGGKDFIIAHPSADAEALVTAIVRGGYEFQGQKCSAASRIYVARSVWERMQTQLCDTIASLTMGDVRDYKNFMGAVIKREAFDKHRAAIEAARKAPDARVVCGGETDDSKGFFVRPTLIVTENPGYRTMEEELFGPIVTAMVYDDKDWEETLAVVDRTSPYALTGAVFANERVAIDQAMRALRHSAGNFYINDKPTGAVVGQQPFGGARASGTNDKAGAPMNLLRWTSARTIKENFCPPTSYRYPYLG